MNMLQEVKAGKYKGTMITGYNCLSGWWENTLKTHNKPSSCPVCLRIPVQRPSQHCDLCQHVVDSVEYQTLKDVA